MVTVNGASGVNAAKLVAEDNKQESENATNRSRQKEERNVMSLDQVKKLRNATQILVDVSRFFYGTFMKTQRSQHVSSFSFFYNMQDYHRKYRGTKY